MIITLQGPPIALQRHRMKRLGNMMVSYDPQKALKEQIKKDILSQISKRPQFRSEKALADSFDVKMEFHLPISKSSTKAQKNDKLWGVADQQKPDCTNLAKFYEDAMNGLVYHDDAMIESLSVSKKFSDKPCTIIEILPKKKKEIPTHVRKIMKDVSPEQIRDLVDDFISIEGIDQFLFSPGKEPDIETMVNEILPSLGSFVINHWETLKALGPKKDKK